MKPTEQEHLEAIEDTLTNKNNKVLAAACAKITRRKAEAFAEWLLKNCLSFGSHFKNDEPLFIMMDGSVKTTSELYDIWEQEKQKP